MISTIIMIVKILIASLPFIALCFFSRRVNLARTERSKQVYMPIVAFVYALITAYFLDYISEGLLWLIKRIPEWISSVATIPWMPGVIGDVFETIGNGIDYLLRSLNLHFWMFFVSNTAMILGYLLVKKIAISFMQKYVKTDEGTFHSKVAGLFYEYFPEKSKWCIRENNVQMRNLFKTLYYGAVVLSCLLMLVSRSLYLYGLMQGVFYPVFGIVIVGELYFFLDGLTRREYTEDILGEDEEAYKVVNYSLLRKFLRSLFGDKLLSENTTINNVSEGEMTTYDILRKLEEDDDAQVATFAAYYDILHRSGFRIDQNYLNSSLDMMKGKSILFNNPFYNDLIPYAFYPMNRALLNHQKVLVILGRHTIEEDIKAWVEKGIEAVTNIPFMWNVEILNRESEHVDIGIVTRSDVLDIELHNRNAEFLEQVGFVVVIEPSKLLSTAQIGLNLLVKRCKGEKDKPIVYCLCDKNCDGIVDAMSHALMTSITEVSATKKHIGTSSYMCWSADDEYVHHRLMPNISRYLGLGTELSFAALKSQVSKTKWFGGEAFPVADIRWIDKQYYFELTKYAGLPTTPEAMDEHFETTPNFWSAEVQKYSYLTVEDEAFNMFEILRDFSTRTTEQGFINVISSEYLLKDYMADNASIFEADAKAIPYIVADYTRSNRNTILRLVLLMSTHEILAERLEKELSLLGIAIYDLRKQLWYELYKCYADLSMTKDLPVDYRDAVAEVAGRTLKMGDAEISAQLFRYKDVFDLKTGSMKTVYFITDRHFIAHCVAELKSASYVAEDEKGERYYLGAELRGHIYQKYLPGQFFTFGGKYYEMQYLTADGQVLVRRAADHINNRPAYRQMREYVIRDVQQSDMIAAQKDIAGMKVIKEFADITVNTAGYYRMEEYNNFKTAKKITFEGARNGIPTRTYRNKEILRIELPDLDGKRSDAIRYTITLLFNEIFKTIFAENQSYICAVTDTSFVTDDQQPLTYTLANDGCEINKNSIYIIEDSQLDLGLTVAVERYLERIFKIVHDYLDWHTQTLADSLKPPPEPKPAITFEELPPEDEEPEEDGKKKGFFGRLWEKIKGIFKKKPKDDEQPTDGEELPEDGERPEGEENPEDGEATEGKKKKGFFGRMWEKIKGIFKKKPKDEELTGDELDGLFPPEDDDGTTPADGDDTDGDIPPEDDGMFPEDDTLDGMFPSDDGDTTPDGDELEGMFPPENDDGAIPEDDLVDDGSSSDDGFGVIPASDDVVADDEVVPMPVDGDVPADAAEDIVPVDGDTADEADVPVADGEFTPPAETVECPPADDESDADSVAAPADTDLGFSNERKPYHERYYLLFGDEGEPSVLDLSGTLEYLTAMGMERNPLKQAREGRKIAEIVEATFKPGRPDARYCDFCGAEIYGVEYETLADGRDRCHSCGRTAVKTGEEFRRLYEDVKRNLESFFGIRINTGIRVEMVNSKKLHQRLGQAFIPTADSDGRVLGVAISDKNGYTLMLENGSPRMAAMLTIAHELTHIWQYLNWDDKAITKKYGKELRLEVYEGMAKWVEIQYAYLINEPALAKRQDMMESVRDDEYGRGFLRYKAQYSFSLGNVITKPTPFNNPTDPLDKEYCTPFVAVDPLRPEDPSGDIDPYMVDPVPKPEDVIQGPSNRDPDAVSHYAYGLLNDAEKALYDRLLEAVRNFAPEIEVTDTFTDDQVSKVFTHLWHDHTTMIWWRNGYTMYFNAETHIVTRIELVYCMTKEEAAKRQKDIDNALAPFLDSINNTMSDYEVTLRIYENIIKLVDYDTIGLERQKTKKLTTSDIDDLRSIYGVFVNKKAVCAGYAMAMQYLLNMVGIECTYVTSDTHAWNMIKLEGDYYHIDVTWGDGSNTQKDKSSEYNNYDCFCITTAELLRLKEHTPVSELPLPNCTAVKCNYHRRNRLFFESYDFNRLRQVVGDLVENDQLDIHLKFADATAYDKAKKDLFDKGRFFEIIKYLNLTPGNRIKTTYSYGTSDEKYTMSVHLTKIS